MQQELTEHSLPLERPFAIAGNVEYTSEVIRITLTDRDAHGRGEAVGVDYLGETRSSMVAQIRSIENELQTVKVPDDIQEMLPPGGARNALDCALWDLTAKRLDKTIWQLTGLPPEQLFTVFSIGIDSPEVMAERAKDVAAFPYIKIKLDGDRPVEKLEAIRAIIPEAKIVTDINQGWTFEELKEYAPYFERLGVNMIEQPIKVGSDEVLEEYDSPIPLCADESCQSMADLELALSRYAVINLKLDKAGGLTEALKMRQHILQSGRTYMVGSMVSSSLSMAPAFVLAQGAEFVDIDGPLLLETDDVSPKMHYHPDGLVDCPPRDLWG